MLLVLDFYEINIFQQVDPESKILRIQVRCLGLHNTILLFHTFWTPCIYVMLGYFFFLPWSRVMGATSFVEGDRQKIRPP